MCCFRIHVLFSNILSRSNHLNLFNLLAEFEQIMKQMMDQIPECELGNTLDKHEGNRKILSKFGYDSLKVCDEQDLMNALSSKWPRVRFYSRFVLPDQLSNCEPSLNLSVTDPYWYPFSLVQVRPCEWYYDEFKYCNTIRGKLRDLYVLGGRGDCVDWYKAYDDCMDFRKTKTVLPFVSSTYWVPIRQQIGYSVFSETFHMQTDVIIFRHTELIKFHLPSISKKEKVLNFEKKRINDRLESSKKNDVWKYRTEPPKHFDNDLEIVVPRSNTFSPFDVYESMKERRRNRTPKARQNANPDDADHSIWFNLNILSTVATRKQMKCTDVSYLFTGLTCKFVRSFWIQQLGDSLLYISIRNSVDPERC